MAQIISSTGVTVEFESKEAVALGKAALEYVKQLYEQPMTQETQEEIQTVLSIMQKIGQIANSETQAIKGRLN